MRLNTHPKPRHPLGLAAGAAHSANKRRSLSIKGKLYAGASG